VSQAKAKASPRFDPGRPLFHAIQMKQFASSLVSPRGLGVLLAAFGLVVPAAAQVTPYGSGINPAGSLELTAGSLWIGTSFQLSVRNTAATNPLPGQAYLYLASQPAPGFPAGLVLPGLGLGGPGSNGELLLDVLPPNPFLILGPSIYLGGASAGANFSLSAPPNPSLVGFDIFAQGLLVTADQGFSLGFTNALRITLGGPTPIPGVTPLPGLAIIAPGTFLMGSTATAGSPYFSQLDEMPLHAVTLSKPFWMGTTEVTQAQYHALMGTNPSFYIGTKNPVERVSWFDAQAYCGALTAQQAALGQVPSGYQYRLPTEAEWEYAARAGTTTEYSLGSEILCSQARFSFNYHTPRLEICDFPYAPVPVGSYAASPWGLFDMQGNMLEWCLDSYASYTAAALADPFVTGGLTRVARGGSWSLNSSFCRSARRLNASPGFKANSVGFRVVLAPVLVP
jgi:formylglycine-generating enzyme required for sulfatase activity